MEPVIALRGLTKSYGTARGIIDVDLEVYQGEVFGFLGPNGAGKTTTIRTLLDYIRPQSGSVRVLGLDPQREGARVRRSLGYLPSDFGMSMRLAVVEYLELLLGMMDHHGQDRIAELAERFQLDLGKRIKDLSRGNRQKVGLVSAFMHRPDLYVLDEPSSGLDPLMQQEFYALIREERDRGATVFLSSHVLSEVEEICDRVGVIREGRLIVVEEIDHFRAKTGRLLTVTFSAPVAASVFSALPGVGHIQADGPTLELTVTGAIDGIIKELARHEIVDLAFETSSLERVFLRYYSRKGSVPDQEPPEVEQDPPAEEAPP